MDGRDMAIAYEQSRFTVDEFYGITVFRDPVAGDYAAQRVLQSDEAVSFLAFPGDEFGVAALLP